MVTRAQCSYCSYCAWVGLAEWVRVTSDGGKAICVWCFDEQLMNIGRRAYGLLALQKDVPPKMRMAPVGISSDVIWYALEW